MINHLFNVFVIAIIVMITLGGFVFISEMILNKFPKAKSFIENLYNSEED